MSILNLKIGFQLSIIFSSLILFTQCSTPKFTGETMSLRPMPSGQLALRAGGYGNTQKQAVNNAIENAFKKIFIQGVPQSNQETALLGADAENKYNEKLDFFNSFYKSRADQYILNRKIKGYKFTNDLTPSTEVELIVDLKALRKYLEGYKIIKPFGI